MERSNLASKSVVMDAGTVARVGYRALMKNKRVVIAGLKNRMFAFMSTRLLPRTLVLNLVTALNKNR